MTDSIRRCAEKYASPDTEITAVSAKTGVDSIECYVDEYLAIPAVLKEIMEGDKEGFDAYIIACFGDPGLQAAREVTDKVVLGIAESAIAAAKFISPNFSVALGISSALSPCYASCHKRGFSPLDGQPSLVQRIALIMPRTHRRMNLAEITSISLSSTILSELIGSFSSGSSGT